MKVDDFALHEYFLGISPLHIIYLSDWYLFGWETTKQEKSVEFDLIEF